MATTTKRPVSFTKACQQYVHRYTMEHVPQWARKPHYHTDRKEWLYYAPQYRTDREWYDNTLFPGEEGWLGTGSDCYTSNQSWPLGQWLTTPYEKGGV